MLKVGSKFYNFDELSRNLEEFQKVHEVQLWVRDSRTVIAAAKRARRKSLNPALKYAELTYSCVFGGRRPTDQTKSHNQTSAGGCPFKVRLSTSNDGQALIVKEICDQHNHEAGKKLHEQPRRLYRKGGARGVRKPYRLVVNKGKSSATHNTRNRQRGDFSSQQIRTPFPYLQQFQREKEKEKELDRLKFSQDQNRGFSSIDSPDRLDFSDFFVNNSYTGPLDSQFECQNELPLSPISPSLSSSGLPGDTEEEEDCLERIYDLNEYLQESLPHFETTKQLGLSICSLEDCPPSAISSSEKVELPSPFADVGLLRKQSGVARQRKRSVSGSYDIKVERPTVPAVNCKIEDDDQLINQFLDADDYDIFRV